MKILIFMSMILLMITFLMMMISSILSMKMFMDREKNSPFECGFDPKSSARMPFSLHFFLIAVIFLIFDVEITLLIPMIFNMNISSPSNYMIFWFFFLFILLIGLYHEWYQGALEWPK